jgi:curved DNA-binding protein CbpA
MLVMAAAIVRELGLMHMVSGSETYKTASGAVTQALGRIGEMPIKVGGVQCNMTFMVVDTDSYDVLLGLDLLIKIGAIIDVKQGLIQVRRGPGANVEILPLTVVNLVQRSDSRVDVHGEDGCVKGTEDLSSSRWADGNSRRMSAQESESESDSSEDANGAAHSEGQVEGESEFGDTDLEKLVRLEGPQQILQLTLQNQADEFMNEEITDDDDYADWIRWAVDGEGRKKDPSQVTEANKESVLLQIQEVEATASDDKIKEQIADGPKDDTRWKDIYQKLRINQDLDELKRSLLWRLLGRYQDVFAWNKGEFD